MLKHQVCLHRQPSPDDALFLKGKFLNKGASKREFKFPLKHFKEHHGNDKGYGGSCLRVELASEFHLQLLKHLDLARGI